MGRRYSVPPDTNEKEKIIGGVMTFAQLMYLVLGLGIGAIFFAVFYFLINIYVGIFFLLLCTSTIGPILAFYKVKGYSYDEYLILSYRHKKLDKKIPYTKISG